MQTGRMIYVLLVLIFASPVFAAEGLIALKSPHDASVTVQRLEQQIEARGLTIFARIDHTAGAAKVGITLRPTILFVFGNPRGGTPFMICEQTVGIDLPLKALVWADAQGQVWLGYNDPAYIAKRHGVPNCPAVNKLQQTLQAIAHDTVAP
ncbi:MAG: DUF302 domain-containing protein [Burkholderiales bacterium]|jgi:uncharacterized protein (DUF302 family)